MDGQTFGESFLFFDIIIFVKIKEIMKNNNNIPYIKGTSESIKRICEQYNIRVTYGKFNTLKSVLTKVKPPIDKLHTKNCVYNIVCTCGMTYTGETKRPLTVRIEEHKKAVIKGETHKSKLAEHIWSANGDHIPLWNIEERIGRNVVLSTQTRR